MESKTFSIHNLSEYAKNWGVSIPQPLVTELAGCVDNPALYNFWRGMAVHLVLSTQLQNTIDRIIPDLLTINSETYSIFFRKVK